MPVFDQQSTIGFIGAGAVGGTLAVALGQAGQPKDRPNPLDLVVCQSPNEKTLTRFSPIHDVSIDLFQNLSQLIIS